MSVTVSGTLVNPIGEPVVNAQITLTAIANSLTVLNTFSVTVSTNSSGAYRLQLEEGSYSITVAVNGRSFVYGSVTLDSTTGPSTLNQLLKQHIMESELTPEVILHFRQIQQQVADDRGAFSSIERRANQSAERAGQSRDEAQKYARRLSKTVAAVKGDRDKAEVSAAAAERSQTRAAVSEAKATASQVAALRSEENARVYRNKASSAAAKAANEASTLAARQTGEKIQQQVKTDADRAQEAQNLSEQNKAAVDKAAARIAQQQVKIEQAASRSANSDAAAKAAADLAGQSQQSAAASARAAQQHAEKTAANKQAAQGFRDETASLAKAAKETAKRDVLSVALGGTGANTLAGAKEALGITALEKDALTASQLIDTPWIDLTLRYGWKLNNYNSGRAVYRKVLGMVFIELNIRRRSSSSVMFILPKGYRPASNIAVPVVSHLSNEAHVTPHNEAHVTPHMTIDNDGFAIFIGPPGPPSTIEIMAVLNFSLQ